MRLRTRLVLLIGVASLGPLGVLGLGATSVATRLVGERIVDQQARSADALARYADAWMGLQLRLLAQQVRAFRVDALSDQSLLQFVRLIYRQVPEAHIVSLTSPTGVDLAPSVYRASEAELPELSRDLVPRDRFLTFRAALPLPGGLSRQELVTADGAPVTIGRPYRPDGRAAPVLPVSLTSSEDSERIVSVELGLDLIAEELQREADATRDVVLLDPIGAPVLGGDAGLVDPDVFRLFLGGAAASEIRYRSTEGVEVLASCAPVPLTGWVVVVAEPLDKTTAATSEIRARTGFVAGVAALLSIVLGVLFTRQISGPVVSLKDAALAVAEGDFGRRVTPPASGEIAELMRAFNFMSMRLDRNRREIEVKNAEIEAFNAELQARVEARTKELREAQEQLVQSARLAAVGEMGAGLAHELNNPLAGILGLSQILLAKEGEPARTGMLGQIEELALRCKEIVAHLLRFSHGERGAGTLDRSARDVVDLDEVLDEVLTLVGGPLRQRGVTVEHQASGLLQVRGDRAQLGQALAQLLTSLRVASTGGGVLTVTGERAAGEVSLTFSLAAPDVKVGSDDWRAAGLGFWAARQVLASHGGRLQEPSQTEHRAPGAPLQWRVALPEA